MAMTKWGRKESIIWPPHSPIYTYGAVFIGFVLTGLFLYCRFTFGNSPTSDRALQEQLERAAETISGCSWWALAEFNRAWRRTPT
jgi:hypothetical protein